MLNLEETMTLGLDICFGSLHAINSQQLVLQLPFLL
jgi:hypothetical protein